jgi:hypothetical protein
MSDTRHPDFDRLINRGLDAALTEDEQLELNRAMLRDPELRRTHDELASIDALAGEALRSSMGEPALGFDPMALTEAPQQTRRSVLHHRAWWLMPAAAAAMLVMTFIPQGADPVRQPGPPMVVDASPPSTDSLGGLEPFPGTQRPVYRVGSGDTNGAFAAPAADFGPRSIQRITDRDMLGVMGDSGNVYFFEVDRTRTLSRPKKAAGGELTVGEM